MILIISLAYLSMKVAEQKWKNVKPKREIKFILGSFNGLFVFFLGFLSFSSKRCVLFVFFFVFYSFSFFFFDYRYIDQLVLMPK